MATKKSKKTKGKSKNTPQPNYTVAQSSDGSIQITFQIKFQQIEKARQEAVKELGQDVEVPGFRKGKAPLKKIIEKIPQETLIQKTLSKILPKMVGEVITKEKLQLALYPRFELLKAEEGKDWQVRALTCKLPKVNLDGYKKKIKGAGKTKAIWTPSSGNPDQQEKATKAPSRAEKEEEAIKLLLKTIEVDIPRPLIDEEVNLKLSRLLARLEKLGLDLESYLKSINKDAKSLREEYQTQAKDGISLDLILGEIAKKENIKVGEAEVEAAMEAATANPEFVKNPNKKEQERHIKSILIRRAALNFATSLI